MRSPIPALKQFTSHVNWRFLGAEIAVGFVFFTYTFNGFLAYAANQWAPQWLAQPMSSLLRFTDATLAFTGPGTAWSPLLAKWLVIGFWWYLAILFATSLAFVKPGRLANGLSGLCVGLGSFVLLSWVGAVLVMIASAFDTILTVVFRFVGAVFQFILGFMAVVFPYLAGIALVMGAVYALVHLVRALGLSLVKSAAGVMAAVSIVWLALPLLRWCYTVLLAILQFLAPIVAWIVAAFGVVVMVVLALAVVLAVAGALVLVFGMLGRLAIDQFRTSSEGGRGERPMALAGFSVGSAIALLLIVAAGLPEVARSIDGAWHEHAWMLNTWSPAASHFQALPDGVAAVFAAAFQQASAPRFDALVVLALLTTAAVGATLRWETAEEDVWHARYISADALKVGVGLGMGLVVLVIAANLPDDR